MRILVTGPQGSGKSTQAALLAEKLKLPHIEMGGLMRDLSTAKTAAGKIAADSLKKGILTDAQLAAEVVQKRLRQKDCQFGFVLDGYPRNLDQAKFFMPELDMIFFLELSDSQATKRLILRGRADDRWELIKKRLALYHSETEPLLSYFRQLKILEPVDGSKSISQIHQDIMFRLKK